MFNILKKKLDIFKLKLKFSQSNSIIGKIISADNPRFVTIGGFVRIKDFCRIDCYEKFGGGYL